MAVEFKSSMSKNELLEIAAEHGIEADEDVYKRQVLQCVPRGASGSMENVPYVSDVACK